MVLKKDSSYFFVLENYIYGAWQKNIFGFDEFENIQRWQVKEDERRGRKKPKKKKFCHRRSFRSRIYKIFFIFLNQQRNLTGNFPSVLHFYESQKYILGFMKISNSNDYSRQQNNIALIDICSRKKGI